MIIQFNNIRLNNFMSFEDETVQLDNLGYTLVSGKNEAVGDSALSNGSGKSSIWEGIVWALTGETIRGNKNIVNIFGNDGAVVCLDFNVDDVNFVIQRTKDHSKLKSSLTISVNGKDISGKGIRDSEAILKQQIPDLTSSLLSSVIILGQGLPQRFSNNTPSGRKQVLEELSKSDFMIEDLKQRISTRKTFLNDSLLNIQKSALSEQTKKDIFSKQLEEEKEKLESLSSSSIVDIENDVTAFRDQCSSLEQQVKDLEEYIKERKEEADSIRDAFYSKQSESTQNVIKINASYSDKLTELTVEIAKVNTDITANKRELSRLKNITDVCPTCGQKLVGVTKPDTTPVENTLQQLKDRLSELQQEQASITQSKSEELRENDKLFAKQLKEIQTKKDEVSREIEQKEREYRQLSSQKELIAKKLLEAEHLLSTAETEKRNTEEKIKSLEDSISGLDTKLLYYNEEEDNTKNHLGIVNKMETIVKRDFRGCLLKNVIDFINNRAKTYSRVVFDNDLLEFKQEGNNISISFDNKEYESLSGGEQKKLDVIIQLAIRDMLCHLMNFSSNILVCDEIFDALDITGCQKIIDLVSTHLEDVSSVFIVTHRDNLCIPCDNEITVIKDVNKISHVIQKA